MKTARRDRTRAARGLRAAGCLAPAATLALLPKCPACLAAAIAMATGLGLSVPAASIVRTALIVCCVASLILVAAVQVRRWANNRSHEPTS